jgi:hypothetical protein
MAPSMKRFRLPKFKPFGVLELRFLIASKLIISDLDFAGLHDIVECVIMQNKWLFKHFHAKIEINDVRFHQHL